MKKVILITVLLAVLGLLACGGKNDSPKLDNAKEIENIATMQKAKVDTMSIEAVGNEIANLVQRSSNFILDKIGNSPKVDSKFKSDFKGEREQVYAQFIPLIKKYRTYSEEERQKCGISMITNLATFLEGYEDKMNKLGPSFEALEKQIKDKEEDLELDIQSLFLLMEFLEVDDIKSNPDLQKVAKHVGLE